MGLCVLEPAISLCLTSIVEMKLARHIVKLPWALTTLKRIRIAKHGLLPTTKHAVEMEKGSEPVSQSFLTSDMRFEATRGEGLSELMLSLKQNRLWVLRSEGWEMSCQPRELLMTQTSAGRQQSGSPGELGFLSGQEVLLLQEMGQFLMIKVKGAAHKQKGVVLN